MRAIGMLDNGFKKNSWVKSAIEYQKRFARDTAKSSCYFFHITVNYSLILAA